ncbi:unnamed protein product [Linum trigynum]|uniref:Uncharacterized protein n=1 Tax=Linum trigynum TaxID=586398 RepID=A0AAV2DSU0_9ROSI
MILISLLRRRFHDDDFEPAAELGLGEGLNSEQCFPICLCEAAHPRAIPPQEKTETCISKTGESNSKLSRRKGARGRRQLRFSGSRRLRKSERRQLSTLTWMNGMLSPNLSMSKLPEFVLPEKG